MRKTMILTALAFACVATTLIPSASACYSSTPAVNYAYCSGGAARDAASAVGFVVGEAGDAVAFVQGTELWDLLF